MSVSFASKRFVAQLARQQGRAVRVSARRHASSATASNLSEQRKSDISREASLPNPDPSEDSQSVAFLKARAPSMVPTYVRPPPVMVKGEGCYIWDMENHRYLDFTAGIAVNALGHCDEGMVNWMAQQSETLIHCSNLYHNAWTPELSKLLINETKKADPNSNLSQVFICNSGSEANEAALKFARKVSYSKDPNSGKTDIVSFHNSFHGRTFGSLSATPNKKYQAPFGPMVPGFRYGTYNDISAIADLITDKTCGVIIEPIQGEGGINIATTEFLQALRKRCDEVDAILIFDEIQCGLSRTGSFWGYIPSGVQPDIITTAKALGNGFPIGATLVSESAVTQHIKTGDHGTTFGGNPLACRLAHYIVSRLASPDLQLGVQSKLTPFKSAFDSWTRKYPGVFSEFRGRGLIIGFQFAEKYHDKAAELVTAARERGLLVITAGTGCLRIVPPLTITEEEIGEGLEILEEAMDAVFKKADNIGATRGQQEIAGR
ncbi:putative acetylornithine aminotransferase [Phaeomoniella chlamydospora]|uniref:acetylornithine transaminase n=1 Tax=Phaeomoniella chlamydospora TaxID=158046 RepID=A0A0G2EMX2_PHACM|nr:putative acetylornithine aminotransferase [Phaeomoniella chlamydospora]